MQIRNVVLVQPNMLDIFSEYPTLTLKRMEALPPLGLCYIASVLEQEGCEVSIIDNYIDEFDHDTLAKEILSFQPDLVGFSATAVNVFSIGPIAARIKESSRNIFIVCGGPQATLLPSEVIRIPGVDFVVLGEGEQTIVELLRFLRDGGINPSNIPGLSFYDDDKHIVFTKTRSFVPNIDSLPIPNRRLLNLSRYKSSGITINGYGILSLSSSRGCPFQCTFCSSSTYWKRRHRYRSATNVVDEIEILVKDFNAKGFCFREDIFTINKRRLKEFCAEMHSRGLSSIPWECETRVDSIDRQHLAMMHDAGCRGTWVGVESGSPRILKQIKKGITVDQVREFFASCHATGIAAGAGFMLGFPDETAEDIEMSLQLGIELDPRWAWYQAFVGFPGSEIYQQIVNEGLFRRKWGSVLEVAPKHFSPDQILDLESSVNNRVSSHLNRMRANRTAFPTLYLRYSSLKDFIRNILGDRTTEKIVRHKEKLMHFISKFFFLFLLLFQRST